MVPGFSLEEVLVFTRLAADAVQPTKMDRPEDVQPSLHNGRIYVACTNNTDRGKPGKEGPTEPNPRPANKDGHVVEIAPTSGDHTAPTFSWNLILICGDPATAGTYFGGYDRPGLADRVPGQRRLRQRRQPLDLHRRPARARWRTRRALQGAGRRSRARAGPAVPRRARPEPRPAARSSTTATARSSSPSSTRARTAPGTRPSPAFPDFVPAGEHGASGATSPVRGRRSSRSPAADRPGPLRPARPIKRRAVGRGSMAV